LLQNIFDNWIREIIIDITPKALLDYLDIIFFLDIINMGQVTKEKGEDFIRLARFK
jgi:hypothetical protein